MSTTDVCRSNNKAIYKLSFAKTYCFAILEFDAEYAQNLFIFANNAVSTVIVTSWSCASRRLYPSSIYKTRTVGIIC